MWQTEKKSMAYSFYLENSWIFAKTPFTAVINQNVTEKMTGTLETCVQGEK